MPPVNRSVTYRLSPSASQRRELERLHRLHRQLYNAALEERIDAWRKGRVSIGYIDQCKSLTQIRRENPEDLAVNAQSAQVTLKRLDRAFAAFFRRCQAGQTPGFPRFKGRGSRAAIASPAGATSTTATASGSIRDRTGSTASCACRASA